jgi:hypothetical protein
MRKRLSEIYPLPAAGDLSLRLPGNAETLTWPDEEVNVENLRNLSMEDLFHERIVYAEFLEYSKKRFTDENVYYARAMSIFKCHWKHADPSIKGCPPEAEEMAWLLFRFFICPGSPFEVSMKRARCKEIMQGLADPKPDMFFILERSCHKVIRDMYSVYSFTPQFALLPEIIRKKRGEMVLMSPTQNERRASGAPWLCS